jgi:PAS domain S-box-containing protein
MHDVFANLAFNVDQLSTRDLDGELEQRVGSFRYYFDDERWEWSAQVSQMHGCGPEALTPTTEQVLAHTHPDDHRQVSAMLDHLRRDRATYSTRHRIIDSQGRIRYVLVAGDQLRDGDAVVGTHGFYVDITPERQVDQDAISEAVAEVAANRAVIEQAKGMLSLVYDIDEDAAFAVLKARSQHTNCKLRALALQLIADFRSVGGDARRATYDSLLLTVHERVAKS